MKKLAIPAILALAACAPEQGVDLEREGALAFAENCAACHGADARGGGPLAEGLPVAPPDLTTLSARNGGTFPRDYVMSVIDGYRRGAHFSDAMPEFGAGDLGPTIMTEGPDGMGTPVPERLLALADYLEGLQQR
ncbi:c-type cytochrome [Histidinibacterium aquaticum]|uniref:Cytochrome c n=1 Tax=Histidinibacterium aquaticum TaxID=2613962 RepID=A0A5J5GNM5_9RHOB|nr:cytochrome c [Histidinibacterium aquaticum]KAA9009899.1 cytochrome c [Histidinibacterium aquaticum]